MRPEGLTWSTAVGEYSVIPLALHRHVRGAASPRQPTFFTTTLQVHVSGGECLAAARLGSIFVVGYNPHLVNSASLHSFVSHCQVPSHGSRFNSDRSFAVVACLLEDSLKWGGDGD